MDISRFESLGDNCEFGFVQRRLLHEDGSLFRWARMDIWQLYAVLINNFDNLYQFEKLVPLRDAMVSETYYGFGWHSKMYSTASGGERTFRERDETRRLVHGVEYRKHNYLVHKFLSKLRAGGVIYVIKSNSGIDPVYLDLIERELRRLSSGASFWILEIRATKDLSMIGNCLQVSDRRMVGFVSGFADYDTADKFDLEIYEAILAEAVKIAPYPEWHLAVDQVERDLVSIKVSLPFPKKDFIGEIDIASDFGWCKASIFKAHYWSRNIENQFRIHAFDKTQDRAKLAWASINKPGQWNICTSVSLAVDDSLPVAVQMSVMVNGNVTSQRQELIRSTIPVQIETQYSASNDDEVAYEIEVHSLQPVLGNQRAVVDIEEITLETV